MLGVDSTGSASRTYVRATLLCALAWQSHIVLSLFRRGSAIPQLWEGMGRRAALDHAALCADVLRRDPIPQKYAAWVFASVAIATFVLEAWVTEAFFAPILRLANAGI